MATKRTVATPGQDPQNTDNEQANGQAADNTVDTSTAIEGTATPAADAFQASSTVTEGDEPAGDQIASLTSQVEDLAESQKILLEQNAALADQVRQLLAAGMRVSQAAIEKPVELPGISDAAVKASTVPVLTKDGWFVPESSKWAVSAGKGN